MHICIINWRVVHRWQYLCNTYCLHIIILLFIKILSRVVVKILVSPTFTWARLIHSSLFFFLISNEKIRVRLIGREIRYVLKLRSVCAYHQFYWPKQAAKGSTVEVFSIYSVLLIYQPRNVRFSVFTVRHLSSRIKFHINNVIYFRIQRFQATTVFPHLPL
jgi:hypothetical protein